MKTKKMLNLIARHGGVLVRTSGSHRMYRLGDKTLVIPFSGSHLEVSSGVKCKILKALRSNGAPV